MQDIKTEKPANTGKIWDKLSIEDKQKLVGAFAWLIQEDKKQNPALYKQNNKQ
jgi:hypothetical protein